MLRPLATTSPQSFAQQCWRVQHLRASIALQAGKSKFMDYYIILYFFVGILQDFLVTLNWRYIAKHKIAPAMLLSFLVTITTMLVIYNILSRLDSQRSIIAIVIYASGVAVGTFLAMKFKVGMED
ncbi:MAG: hypothetical protein CO140_04060 [Candidatus Moranbacteria bacterium CG_4_9_14_3_um_filter_40_7]|nr:MAG: hypothetical protein COS71_02705 [Candidatus Moranbacteria bacterium CG06_land_8_20_14_3_00_40_12]PJA87493.1 MAG: hypothetical protein CO140_04060 [Candidatus Moranbacteria bacterium CG_4_9_14_3_um_filter_40_7]